MRYNVMQNVHGKDYHGKVCSRITNGEIALVVACIHSWLYTSELGTVCLRLCATQGIVLKSAETRIASAYCERILSHHHGSRLLVLIQGDSTTLTI